MSSQRTNGSSSQSAVSKGRMVPFMRCYCGLGAPLQVSWSGKNPGRRYFGCRYFPDEDEDCGYFEWYDDETTSWYKQVLNELKEKKKKKPNSDPNAYGDNGNTSLFVEDGYSNLLFLVRVMFGLLVCFIFIVGIVLCLLLKV